MHIKETRDTEMKKLQNIYTHARTEEENLLRQKESQLRNQKKLQEISKGQGKKRKPNDKVLYLDCEEKVGKKTKKKQSIQKRVNK
ncbi:hypothetical protein SynBOUM118_01041 [Synechococcus sp. BOUM118]|nr:hypothetical protein SynBOUM118_01041 [Synechococcus sp. BOUM118]